MTIASNISKGLLNPDLTLLFGLTTSGILYLLFETICIAFLGTIFGAFLGAPLIFVMNSYRWNEVESILIGLIFLILLVQFFSNKMRANLVKD
ncbi:hypothetical protein [Carnobacterium sp.]|uniref:hypothetical protein n=1 Tax=Carnobacterium sp. TaxID=48221 RepID=UPI00389015EE